jgi:hypothetical protein
MPLEVAMTTWRNEAIIDILNLVLGAVLLLSPWIFAFEAGAQSQNAVVFGVVIAVLAIAGLVAFAEWEEWLNLAAGLWVLVSPWVLGFTDSTNAMHVHLWIGIVVAVLAGIEIYLVHRHPPGVTASR